MATYKIISEQKDLRIFNEFSLVNLLLHLINCGEIVMYAIHLAFSGISRCVTHAETKVRRKLFAQELDKCPLSYACDDHNQNMNHGCRINADEPYFTNSKA